mmetsp:Transcript_10610/g.16918  ORF Transcript_10610/g.16918 Transcript_10610/m.16918 type:complete len:92 (-) Transcript_10610:331-606(-)
MTGDGHAGSDNADVGAGDAGWVDHLLFTLVVLRFFVGYRLLIINDCSLERISLWVSDLCFRILVASLAASEISLLVYPLFKSNSLRSSAEM